MPIPRLTPYGLLPSGIHDCTWEEIAEQFVYNASRQKLWRRFESFRHWIAEMNLFSCLYLGGGFITAKPHPSDIDVIIQTRASYGPQALESMSPVFKFGLEKVLEKYSVHAHFWCEGFPGGIHDFRRFFQYVRPQEGLFLEGENLAPTRLREDPPDQLPREATKGIVRIPL